MDKNEKSPSVARAAGAMGAATLISRFMGLIREQVFAIFFGAGNLTDAYNIAFRIPNLMRDLFAEGAMSASLVPIFTRTRIEQGERRAWRVAGLVFRALFVFVSLLSILGIYYAPELVGLYAGAFREIPGKFELTVKMTRVMFPFFPLVALAAAFMGILNACGKYFLPAFASAVFNVVSVCTGLACAEIIRNWGAAWGGFWATLSPIEGMAIGVVLGGLLQACCQLPTLYRVGYSFPAKEQADPVWYQDPELKRMLWMMLPGTLGLAATQVNLLVNTVLATTQGPGAVSWLSYAFRLMQFPIGIFGVSLASATLPRVSSQWAKKDVHGVSQTLTQSLKMVFAINLPASAGLAFLGYPIIELIFQYGRFQASDTLATARALAMYSVGLAAYSTVKVLVPACYALGNTRVPVISSFVAVALTIVLNLLMVKSFGYWGLALGTSLAAIANAVFLLVAIRSLLAKKGATFSLTHLLISFFQYLAVALTMGGLCHVTHSFISAFMATHYPQGRSAPFRSLQMAFLIFEGILAVILIVKVFGMKEATDAINLFTKKIKNMLRRAST